MNLLDHYNWFLDRDCNYLVLKHRHLNDSIDGFDNLDYFFSDLVDNSVNLFHNNFLDNFFDDNFNSFYLDLFLFDKNRHFNSLRNVKDLSNNCLDRDDLIDINWYFDQFFLNSNLCVVDRFVNDFFDNLLNNFFDFDNFYSNNFNRDNLLNNDFNFLDNFPDDFNRNSNLLNDLNNFFSGYDVIDRFLDFDVFRIDNDLLDNLLNFDHLRDLLLNRD